MTKNIKPIHFDKAENLAGIVVSNARQGEMVRVLVKARLTSNQPEFYTYIEQISNMFLGRANISMHTVFQFLVLIHNDLSADLYVNDFPVLIEVCSKRDVDKGEKVIMNDIADIRRLKFQGIAISETDKVVYCFKCGWKFGLFFDYQGQNLNVDEMYLELGHLYRYLLFEHVYRVLESESQFEEMMNDGWFPFIEISGSEFKALSRMYQDKFDFQNKIEKFVNSFDKNRVDKITTRWWKKNLFGNKRQILQAGTNAFLKGDSEGYIQCLKTLYSEVDGIIRLKYFEDTKKNGKTKDLLKHITERGKLKSGSDSSLFLPSQFLEYLGKVVFTGFDITDEKVKLSRNSVDHGAVKPEKYTKARALQAILILDQICRYV